MKATGVVRRIDDLGRIVIPKEIRKTLRIKEGDSLEIYIDEEEHIVLNKFSVMAKIEDFAQKFTDAIYSFLKKNIMIANNDTILAFSGPMKKDYLGKPVSESIQTYINRRDSMLEKYEKDFCFVDGDKVSGTYALSSIVANGDAVGIVIIFGVDVKVTEADEQIAKIAAQFLAKYLEQ